MEKITIREILTATGGKLISGNEDTIINDITTDSRKAEPGVLFVALKGDNFDGNDFADEFLKGGEAVVVEKDLTPISGKGIIRVDDTKKALRDIAKYYRGKFNIPVIGVTGSVGKTSTKDMLASVLSQKYSTLKTQGNFNNEIGLPLTVFNLTKENEVAVIEMGMNNFGEISRLTNIAQPSIAVITNIGTAHIGNLGSQQNILKAKLEILEKLIPNGIVVLNGDDKILYSLKGKLPHTVIYYGIDNLKADIEARNLEIDDIVNINKLDKDFNTKNTQLPKNVVNIIITNIKVTRIENTLNELQRLSIKVFSRLQTLNPLTEVPSKFRKNDKIMLITIRTGVYKLFFLLPQHSEYVFDLQDNKIKTIATSKKNIGFNKWSLFVPEANQSINLQRWLKLN